MDFLAAIDKPFVPGWTGEYGLRAFAPELWLIGTIIAVLLTPFFIRRANLACAVVSLAGLALALLATIVVNVDGDVVGLHLRGLLVADHFAVMWKILLYVFVIGIILMWFSTTAATMHEGDGPEFFTLLIGATLGMSLMAGTSNLLMIFMSVELASLSSAVLAGFRKTNRIAAEASLKYILFGAATSAIMVYGLTLLYGLYGTLQVEELAVAMTQSSGGLALLAVAMFGLIVGIGFKISAVPFHFWCPDVFEGASIDVSAFLSVASKGAALVLLMRVLMIISSAAEFQNVPGISLTAVAVVIGVLGSITATVGNTAAFVQNNIKRLLAYSSIAHAGYMLCALSLLVRHNSELVSGGDYGATRVDAAQAILVYLAAYLFMNLGAFTVAGLIHRQTGSEDINDYAALGRRAPVLAACMFACMISLIGLPPFAGFMAKLNLLWVLMANGGWWWALIVVIGVNTILSAFYYFRVIKVMYVTPSDAPALSLHPLGTAVSVVCVAMLFIMLVAFYPLYSLTSHYSQIYLGDGAAASVETASLSP